MAVWAQHGIPAGANFRFESVSRVETRNASEVRECSVDGRDVLVDGVGVALERSFVCETVTKVRGPVHTRWPVGRAWDHRAGNLAIHCGNDCAEVPGGPFELAFVLGCVTESVAAPAAEVTVAFVEEGNAADALVSMPRTEEPGSESTEVTWRVGEFHGLRVPRGRRGMHGLESEFDLFIICAFDKKKSVGWR